MPVCLTLLAARPRDYEAKSALDSYESAGIDNEVTDGGYEEQLAAARLAEESLDREAATRRRGRKRMPGALEGMATTTSADVA